MKTLEAALLLACLTLFPQDALAQPTAIGGPLAFERNIGQHDPDVKYVARGVSHDVILDQFGAVLMVPQRPSASGELPTQQVRIGFARSSGSGSIEADDQVAGVSHFLTAATSVRDVPSYARVAYRNLYPGIDALFHASDTDDLEIDFVVAPGSLPSAIGLDVDGAWLTPTGDLRICAGDVEVGLRRPVAYQVINGVRQDVQAAFVRGPGDEIRFEVGSYDLAQPLTIDPEVIYATAIAKTFTVGKIAVDNQQNAYVVGSTQSSTFTTTSGSFQPTFQAIEDAVIIKYSKSGQRIFATFLGGQGIDRGVAIAVDDEQSIYVTGWVSNGYDDSTQMPNFPVTPGAYHTYPLLRSDNSKDDVWVTKLTASGSALAFSCIVGGSGHQEPAAIAVDRDKNVYVAGHVVGPPSGNSSYKQFPATGYRTTARDDFWGDGFVFILDPTGSALVASTLFGGLLSDDVSALAVDNIGDVWVVGQTTSFDFPHSPNACRSTFVGPTVTTGSGGFHITTHYADAFAVKFDHSLNQLLYGTFLPGSNDSSSEFASDVATDPDRNAYVVGYTPSDDFPTTSGVYQTATHGGFITKFSPAGQVIFSTILGGATPSNAITSISGVRTSGDVVFVAGSTGASDFATKGAFQSASGGGSDMFACVLNATGTTLEFSTFLGGSGGDGVAALALDTASNLYILGGSSSPNFPYSANAAEPAVSGNNNVYVKVSSDRDGDGLLDWWELSGIDVNGDGTIDLDLAALGAKVDHKDIFVEADYMAAGAHTHDPRTLPSGTPMSMSAIAPVVTAFANAPVTNPDGVNGINLHVLIDESITEQTPISFLGVNSGFDLIKRGPTGDPCSGGHFGTAADRSSSNCANIMKAKRRVYRYCILAHNFSEVIGSTGIGELAGNDFIVSLRVREPFPDYETFAASAASRFGTSLEVEWRDKVAGTFMHELGHTLGLMHGGGNGLLSRDSREKNCKPNYLSVMSYSRQINQEGTAPGTSAPQLRTNRQLDYSHSALAPLIEAFLTESSGVGGPSGMSILYGEGTTGTPRIAPAAGSIDWNGQNGVEATPVTADINSINTIRRCSAATPGEILEGHDDWSNLVYNFRMSPDYADGVTVQTQEPEMTDQDVSGSLLGTQPPVVTITTPADGTHFAAGASVSIAATATDPDGSVASVYFLADDALLSTQTTAPFAYTWTGAATGTHAIYVGALDDVGAVGWKSVTIHVGCTAAFSPISASVVSEFVSGAFDMTLAAGCQWAATSDSNWLTVTPAMGAGAAQFTYTALDNPSTQTRTGTLTIAGQTFVVTQDGKPPFGPPTSVLATGDVHTATPFITVAWHGSGGATSYEVAFSANGTSYTSAGTTSDRSFTFATGVSANAAYLVKVRAINSGGTQSAYSPADLATTFVFTDDPLIIGVTPAKSVHWTELRTAINAVRQVAGLSAAAWVENVGVGQLITHAGIGELRTALNGARTALLLGALTYTDDPLTTGTTIRAAHIVDLRAGVQ